MACKGPTLALIQMPNVLWAKINVWIKYMESQLAVLATLISLELGGEIRHGVFDKQQIPVYVSSK